MVCLLFQRSILLIMGMFLLMGAGRVTIYYKALTPTATSQSMSLPFKAQSIRIVNDNAAVVWVNVSGTGVAVTADDGTSFPILSNDDLSIDVKYPDEFIQTITYICVDGTCNTTLRIYAFRQ